MFSVDANASGLYLDIGEGGFISNSQFSFTENSTSVLFSPTTPGTSLFILPNVHWKNHFNNGLIANLALGYQFTPYWRADIEFLYQHTRRDISGTYNWQEINSVTQAVFATSNGNPLSEVSTDVNLYTFFTNGYLDFKNCTPWTPSIGVGIGFAWINSGDTSSNNTLVVNDPAAPLFETVPVLQKSPSLYGVAFAWQVKALINYRWTKTISAALQYRLFCTTRFKASSSTITSNPGIPGATTIFTVGQHDVDGILTNALELHLRFDIV